MQQYKRVRFGIEPLRIQLAMGCGGMLLFQGLTPLIWICISNVNEREDCNNSFFVIPQKTLTTTRKFIIFKDVRKKIPMRSVIGLHLNSSTIPQNGDRSCAREVGVANDKIR